MLNKICMKIVCLKSCEKHKLFLNFEICKFVCNWAMNKYFGFGCLCGISNKPHAFQKCYRCQFYRIYKTHRQNTNTSIDRADYADIDTKPNFLFLNKPKVKDMKLSSFIFVVHICLTHGRQKKHTEFEMIAIEALQNLWREKTQNRRKLYWAVAVAVVVASMSVKQTKSK